MKFHILTLFPEMFGPVLDASILKRGQAAGVIDISVHNIRDFTTDKHHVTDDSPYGGGPGMVMKPEPIAAAVEAVRSMHATSRPTCIYLSPQGELWNQQLAQDFAQKSAIILLCGHYEGIDERAREQFVDREISIGDYVLTGGELPAMVLIDSISRLVPGVVGNQDSVQQDSFSADGLLDHPHYTRPEEFRGQRVPDVLLSGHHKKIQDWRRLQAIERTLQRRPELLQRSLPNLSPAEQRLVDELLRDSEKDPSA